MKTVQPIKRPTTANHFVPQAYQKRFVSHRPEDADQLWVYDKTGQSPKLLPIRVIGVKNDLYSLDGDGVPTKDILEQEVFTRIENEANPLIEKVVSTESVPQDGERGMIAAYMACAYIRVPRYIRSMQEIKKTMHVEWLKTLANSPEAISRMMVHAADLRNGKDCSGSANFGHSRTDT